MNKAAKHEIIKEAKIKLPDPKSHFFSEVKIPVQYFGTWYKVTFRKITQNREGEKVLKWFSTEEVEPIKGGLRKPIPLLY